MATQAHAFFDRWGHRPSHAPSATVDAREAFRLRAFANQDVHVFVKRIDNSRVVRQSDPGTRRACWGAIAASCSVAIFLTAIFLPGVYHLLAGYKVETLRQDRQRLEAERSTLEFQETNLLTNESLGKMAHERKFLRSSEPRNDYFLEGKPENSVAVVASKDRLTP